MNSSHFFAVWVCVLLSVTRLTSSSAAQNLQSTTVAAKSEAVSEIERLARVLVDDWNTTETMERSEFFPTGGSRHGVVHASVTAGGTALLYEVHSDGSAGKLEGMLVIWWDEDSHIYRLFACFNNPHHPCTMRGTAHWDGQTFVNDYEETSNGKKTIWRDSFTFTPTSHTLVAAVNAGNGTMQPLITTQATRR